jgi:acyl-CoA thioester hydrolase
MPSSDWLRHPLIHDPPLRLAPDGCVRSALKAGRQPVLMSAFGDTRIGRIRLFIRVWRRRARSRIAAMNLDRTVTERFLLPVRVYYEDTDAGGVVYYANYLRYFERARTEWLRALGFEQDELMQNRHVAFAARSAHIEYLKSARLDDLLTIASTIAGLGRAQVIFHQCVERNSEVLVDARIRIASIDPVRGKPVAMPKEIHEQFKTMMGRSA